MRTKSFKKIGLFFIVFLFFFSFEAGASTIGERNDFYVDSSFDINGRQSLSAKLIERSSQLYFYVDEAWWNKISFNHQSAIKASINNLSRDFESKTYPALTSVFGFENKPGLDKDERITVLLHPLKEGYRGYIRTSDGYSSQRAPGSNEKEMVYINVDYISEENASSYLAHEFQHLITFNQKEKKYGISEEVWFQEMLSEYAPTLAGLNDNYQGSYLQKRAQTFIANPNDSLTEWQGKAADYGVLNLFAHYLVEKYGQQILVDSLHAQETGIGAIDFALTKNGHNKTFSQVFDDWLLAVLINDCSYGYQYCYQTRGLEDFRISPSLNFLPFAGRTNLIVEDSTKDWAGRWYKLMGGRDGLSVNFDGNDETQFYVAYLLCSKDNFCEIKRLDLDGRQKGVINVADFGASYESLTLVIYTKEKTSDFGAFEASRPFVFRASTMEDVGDDNSDLINSLLEQIAFLQAKIAEAQMKITAILAQRGVESQLAQNLRIGDSGSQVTLLQQFLKSQGAEIYPQGLVTGYFGTLTQAAVVRFQERHSSDILAPVGLMQGNGFVGPNTRSKINSLLSGS